MHAQDVREWNFSDAKWKTFGTLGGKDTKYTVTFSKQTECDGLTIYGTSDRNMVIDNNTKTVDEVKYTYRLKLGGDGAFNEDNTPKQRVISLTVKNKTSIYVVLANSSSSGDRSLQFDALVDGKRTNFGEIQVTGGECKSATVNYAGDKEATIFIYGKGGINIYDIKATTESTETPTTADIKISDAKMATYSNTSAWEVPEGMEVYTATYADGKVKLNQVTEKVIPANTGVVISGEAKTYTAKLAASAADLTEENDLIGATEKKVMNNETTYILVKDKATQKVMFGKLKSGQEVKANSAYLTINDINAAKTVSIDFGNTTGINAIETTENNKNGEYYTLSGQRTVKPTKGIYILNGKKYIAK